LIVATFLTRSLGPHQFGLYALAAAVILWIEWSINSLLGRSSIQMIGRTEEWQPVAAAILNLGIFIALLASAALVAAAGLIARLFHEPELAGILRVFALDIPFWTYSQSHRAFAIGREFYTVRWRMAAARWILRALFIVAAVSLLHSPYGVAAGWIATSCVEAVLGRVWLPVRHAAASVRAVWPGLLALAAPLSAFGMILRFYDKLDLFLLKALGISTAAAGVYGAAQSISLAPGIMTMSFAPLLLGSVTRSNALGNTEEARTLSRHSLHFLGALFPGILLAGAFSTRIVHLVFGSKFLDAAALLPWLLVSAYFTSMLSFCASIQTAFGRHALPLRFALPMLPLAFAGNLLLIPRFGSAGAAAVSACVAGLSALPLLATTYSYVRAAGQDQRPNIRTNDLRR
jgi:O-antigen/teichoic acid export membrane protein